jgi:predicted Zn-dependent peptidase
MDIIGTKENILRFNEKHLSEYYKNHYYPQNMVLVIVGDVELKAAKELSDKYFSIKVSNKEEDKKIYNQRKLSAYSNKVFVKQVNQIYKARVYTAPSLKEKEKCFDLDVLSEILSGGEHSLLNRIMKHENMAVNYVYGGFHGQKFGGAFTFFYSCDPNDFKKAEKIFGNILNDIYDLINDNELQKAKNRLKSQIGFQREKCYMEANDIGHSYIVDEPDYYHSYINEIEKVNAKRLLKTWDEISANYYCEAIIKPEN